MMEMTIHGRGGQGGVTLAKLIATAFFNQGKYVQAFGVYAAERSGAPLQAYVRVDDDEIVNHNQVESPDHVIVLDRTLIGPHVAAGMKPGGWLILNSPDPPEAFEAMFPGRKVATVDATAIAVENGLGTKAVPIVNTTVWGAVARALGLERGDVDQTLASLKFGGSNVASADRAYECAAMKNLAGVAAAAPERALAGAGRVAGLFDDAVGGMPGIHTGNWATHRPHRHQLTPPCNHGCPAGNNVRGFVEAAAQEDYAAALEIILETSPFPGVCGRVCPAPCMEACNRAAFDEAVNVREIERFIADHAARPVPSRPWRPEQIAVVGSGPAGLSAAYAMARLGYPVTIFEGGGELGGLMRTGIPEYRLPRHVLAEEIDHILQHGVEAVTGRRVDRAELLRLSREFAAVFVAVGLQTAASLNLGEDAEHADGKVVQGIEFLDRARRGEVEVRGEDVVVIGGGNTAVDAARSALRLGAHRVRIVYRRSRAQMPAIAEEIDEALEEGVQLDELVSPLQLRPDGVGQLLTCQRMKLGPPDESGRARPVPETSEDSVFDLRCHRVILALGQSSDTSILPEGSEVRDGKLLLGLTGAAIFMGGDFATNDGTVTAAIGSGRRAALHIHRTLTGEDLFPPPEAPVAGPADVHVQFFVRRPQERGRAVDPRERRHTFTEVRRGLVDDPAFHRAAEEAQRCFSCGVCNFCDRCVQHCPEGILRRDAEEGYRFDYDYCKGCGVCATQCPRGVIYMMEL